jgi:hypothetical protein
LEYKQYIIHFSARADLEGAAFTDTLLDSEQEEAV